MAPSPISTAFAAGANPGLAAARAPSYPWPGDDVPESVIVEAWGQGFNVGALVLIILVVLCNYRKRVLLHKLILLELILAIWHGFFTFFTNDATAYGWILSSTAAPLYISYTLHNIVAWIKIKPFLPRWGGRLFIISLLLVQPYWILEAYANFQYFNGLEATAVFQFSRYFEPLARDPWWIFTTVKLVLVINKNYEYTLAGLVRTSPRFGVMLLCMFVSIVFLITDVIVTVRVSVQSGINPFWRLALVFKCASDAIFLDDFKSVLDRIAESAIRQVANFPSASGDAKSWRRRGSSSVGLRRESTARPFPNARHIVTISSDRMAETDRKYSGRDGWPGSLLGSNRSANDDDREPGMGAAHDDNGSASDQQRQILAETTITISEQHQRNHTNKLPRDPYGSKENILAADKPSSAHYDYPWGNAPMSTNQPHDPKAGIPMVPIQAKTTKRTLGLG